MPSSAAQREDVDDMGAGEMGHSRWSRRSEACPVNRQRGVDVRVRIRAGAPQEVLTPEDERVVGNALARLGRHGFGAAVDLLDSGIELERDALAGDASGPSDRRVVRHHLAGEHRLRQRRLFVGLAVLVAEHQDLGRLVLIAGRHRGTDRGRSAADDDDLAGVTHWGSC